MSDSPKQTEVLNSWLGFLLNRAYDKSYSEAEKLLKPLGIHPRHARILLVIDQSDDLNQQKVAEIACIHRNVMVSLIDQLENKELVKRVANPDSRREYLVKLTTKGKKCVPKIKKLCLEAQQELLKPLAPDERTDLIRLIGKLLLLELPASIILLQSTTNL